MSKYLLFFFIIFCVLPAAGETIFWMFSFVKKYFDNKLSKQLQKRTFFAEKQFGKPFKKLTMFWIKKFPITVVRGAAQTKNILNFFLFCWPQAKKIWEVFVFWKIF